MCVSYGISLCLFEIRIFLFLMFEFAKLPDNSNDINKLINAQICQFANLYYHLILILNIWLNNGHHVARLSGQYLLNKLARVHCQGEIKKEI